MLARIAGDRHGCTELHAECLAQRDEAAASPGDGLGRQPASPFTPRSLPASSAPRATLQMLFGVQRAATVAAEDPAQVHAAATRGTATPATRLPFTDQVQRAFGRHDISGIHAHVAPAAVASAREIGARAYATGDHVVLGDSADLHTVAHEAAHVIQQRSGVQLAGGVGQAGDRFEAHANRVADQVVRGESAESLLDEMAGPGRGGGAACVQRSPVNYRGGEIPGTRAENSNDFHSALMFKYDGNLAAYLEILALFRAIPSPTPWDLGEIAFLQGFEPGAMPVSGPPQHQESGQTVAQILLDLATQKGITNDVILTLLLEWTSDEINMAGQAKTLRQSLNYWQAFTACYNTAEILFSQLHSGIVDREYAATPNDQASIANTIALLCTSITANQAGRAIHRVKCGVHGFTILVRHGRTELLQSFAGGSGEMLATSLRANKTWSLATMCKLLTAMVGNSKHERAQAQNELFAGGIEDDAHSWPNIELTWKVSALADEATIVQTFGERLNQNLLTLKQHHRGKV
jgi:Domain of unknown function (DUF4157)